jgi:hypothetical protein
MAEPISSLGLGDAEITIDADGLWHLARGPARHQAAE